MAASCRVDRRAAVAEAAALAVEVVAEEDAEEAVRAGAEEDEEEAALVAAEEVGAAVAAGDAAGRAAVADRDHRKITHNRVSLALPHVIRDVSVREHHNEEQIQDTIRVFRIHLFRHSPLLQAPINRLASAALNQRVCVCSLSGHGCQCLRRRAGDALESVSPQVFHHQPCRRLTFPGSFHSASVAFS